MSKWWRRKKRVTIALTYSERERVIAWINEHLAILQHSRERLSSIPRAERPDWVNRNIDYFKHASGGLKWLKASAMSKLPSDSPERKRA